MCHSGYAWFEARRKEAAHDQEAQKKRSAVIDELLSKASKDAAAPKPAPAAAKDPTPAR